MNHPGEIGSLSNCLKPDMAAITNIGTSHIGNLGSRENIANAKLEISYGMYNGKIYVPAEEHLLSGAKNRVTLSTVNPESDFYLATSGNKVTIFKGGLKFAESSFAFLEDHLKKCLLFSCAIAIDSGICPALLEDGISKISRENTRQNMFSLGGYTFIDDSYNASPESILASFDSVKNLKISKRKNLLLGDVLELGNFSASIHYEIGKSIPRELFENVFLFGNIAEDVARGAIENGFHNEKIHINDCLDRPDITALQIKEHCTHGELILMKASRAIKIEKVLDYFQERR